ncbi:MAG: hypothetical protein ABIT08_10660 [Bacteroidia bacterium]
MRFLTSFGMTAFCGVVGGGFYPAEKRDKNRLSSHTPHFVIPNGAKRNEESLSHHLGKMSILVSLQQGTL